MKSLKLVTSPAPKQTETVRMQDPDLKKYSFTFRILQHVFTTPWYCGTKQQIEDKKQELEKALGMEIELQQEEE